MCSNLANCQAYIDEAPIASALPADDVVQCFYDFLSRHGRIEAVNLIQIDIVELQPLQTGIDRMANVFAR